ncbi:MAG: glutathione S-transferase family protein [Solirubrobacteraceae bacterium]
MKLVTIPVSHFCEKARWGLDRSGLQYTEQPYAPVLHRASVMPRGSKTAPVLLLGRRQDVLGSCAILEHCDRHGSGTPLFGEDPDVRGEVEQLVARFDKRLGPPVRSWLYSWALEDRGELLRYCTLGVPSAQRRLVKAALPAFERVMRMAFKVTPQTHAECAERVGAELEFVSDLLADGRQFLAGDRFTAADLTFAALAGPAVSAPGYGGAQITLPDDPPDLAPEIGAWRATPAGRFAHTIYRDWR